MKRILANTMLALMLAAVAHAQADLTGKWQETTPSGLEIELELAATKTMLAGTFTVKGRALAITDGTVSKNTFTFKAKLDDQPEGFTGAPVGDAIELWRDRNGRADTVVLTRVQPELTGKWQGTTKNGFHIDLDLIATGGTLTGTLTRNGEPTKITDGKVSTNTFTFKATLGEQTEAFTGEMAGAEVTVWLDRQGRDRAAILKRVNLRN